MKTCFGINLESMPGQVLQLLPQKLQNPSPHNRSVCILRKRGVNEGYRVTRGPSMSRNASEPRMYRTNQTNSGIRGRTMNRHPPDIRGYRVNCGRNETRVQVLNR